MISRFTARIPVIIRCTIGFTLLAMPLFTLAILAAILVQHHTASAATDAGITSTTTANSDLCCWSAGQPSTIWH